MNWSQRIVLAVFSLLSINANAASNPLTGRLVNAEYRSVWAHTDQLWNEAAKAHLRKFHVLLVPGLMATRAVQTQFILGELEKFLTEAGVPYQISSINPGGDPAGNGAVLVHEIRWAPKPVLLIMDSKGGVDALEGVLDHPEIWPKIAWLSLQAPYGGTPIAEMIAGDFFLRVLVQNLLKWVGGDADALASIGMTARAAYNSTRDGQMRKMAQKMPMLSFACWKKPVPGVFDTLFKQTRDAMLERGFENDGLVPWRSEVFPGSDYIAIEGLDHLTPITDSMLISFDRSRFARTMIYMMLTRALHAGMVK